ncbi:MAG: hypothetical protein QGF74_01420 [Candidatus Nanoarchaeia archaeon]|jgi:hypothetical protein|nr:hypothetical protein [Candidatus Nanoarchaeia archaeon]|tara:strand:+ start:6811 stop:7293 length:483 start_codon:yes stop_codon:yes gene_type:complete
MKKRGQLLSTPFIYVFALIIGSLILIWGMNYVYKLKDTAEIVEVNTFLSDLRKDVDSFFYLDEGSSKVISIRMPSKIDYICFKDKEIPLNNDDILDGNPGFRFILENTNKSVFFLPTDAYRTTTYDIDNIKPKTQNPSCFRNGEKIKITTETDHVEISPL